MSEPSAASPASAEPVVVVEAAAPEAAIETASAPGSDVTTVHTPTTDTDSSSSSSSVSSSTQLSTSDPVDTATAPPDSAVADHEAASAAPVVVVAEHALETGWRFWWYRKDKAAAAAVAAAAAAAAVGQATTTPDDGGAAATDASSNASADAGAAAVADTPKEPQQQQQQHEHDARLYAESLVPLATFHTVEGFCAAYRYLTRAYDLPKDTNYFLFREGHLPMWEEYPKGGCWNISVPKKKGTNLALLWENLCFAAIGEEFEEPDVVGVALSIRKQEDVLSVWNRSNQNASVRFRIGEKLKKILLLEPKTVIEYKNHSTSIKDRSSHRNGTSFIV